MPSKILVRLLRESLIPALLIVCAKLIGIILTVNVANVTWQVSTDFIPQVTFLDPADFVLVSSWSNLIVIFAIALGLFWILIKAYLLHETHIAPHLTLRLIRFNLTQLLSTTVEISHQGVIWLSYLWLFLAFAAIQTYLGQFYSWMLALSVFIAALLTWFFIADIEKELRTT